MRQVLQRSHAPRRTDVRRRIRAPRTCSSGGMSSVRGRPDPKNRFPRGTQEGGHRQTTRQDGGRLREAWSLDGCASERATPRCQTVPNGRLRPHGWRAVHIFQLVTMDIGRSWSNSQEATGRHLNPDNKLEVKVREKRHRHCPAARRIKNRQNNSGLCPNALANPTRTTKRSMRQPQGPPACGNVWPSSKLCRQQW